MTPAERRFFDEARAFGIYDSYVLPYRTAGGRVFAAVFIGPGRETTPELRVRIRTLSHELLLAALRLKAHPEQNETAPRLTARQIQCLTLIRDGNSSAEIAIKLSISARTVDHYIGAACAKLGVRSRAQAVALVISQNMVAPPTPR